MKLIHICPVCNYIRRITNGQNNDRGRSGTLIRSGARITYINPEKCKNQICQTFQQEKLNNPDIQNWSYQEFRVNRNLTEDPKLKFLKME